ncbi:MAG: hypothetical protein QXI18_02480 [Nitrososphaerota archaeon]|nr:hypothetical protein [Thermoproteota archaeon]
MINKINKAISITKAIALSLAICVVIIFSYSFFVVKPVERVNYTIMQNTIYVNPNSGEAYITFTVQNTGTVDFVIKAIVLDKEQIDLPVEGMLGTTLVKVGQRAALRIPLPHSYEPGTVVNLFLITDPPFLEAQKFVVAPTPVEVIG